MVLLCALTPGSRPPFGAVMHIFFVSSFVGNFLPSIGGDVYRAFSLARLSVSWRESAASVLMDRMLGVLSMVMVGRAALLFRDRGLAGVIAGAAARDRAGCAVAAARRSSASASPRWTSGLAGGCRAAGRTSGRAGSIDAVRRYARHHGALSSVLALSIAVQLLRVVQAYCLGRALGIDLPLIVYFGFIPVITAGHAAADHRRRAGHDAVRVRVAVRAGRRAGGRAFPLSMLFLALGIVGNLPGGFSTRSGTTRTRRRT